MALVLLVLVPFLDRPFTIDDPVFLREAEHLLVDPLHPTAFEMVWEFPHAERVSKIAPTGPLMAYLLLPAILAGGDERVAHLVQLALLLVAVAGTVSLARRLELDESQARWAGVLVASTPAALVMTSTCMPDVPALAFAVIGIERLVAWRQSGRAGEGLAAALCLGFAPLARGYLLLLLAPALLLLVEGDVRRFASWKGTPPKRWLPVLAAPVATLAVMFVCRDPQEGTLAIARTAGFFAQTFRWERNLLAFLANWTLVMPLGIGWLLGHRLAVPAKASWWCCVAVAAAIMFAADERAHSWWMPLVAGTSLACLVDLARSAWRRGDAASLALVGWLLLSLPVVIYVHLPAKFLVPSSAAAALLLVMQQPLTMPGRRASFAMVAVLGSLLGFAMIRADTRESEYAREVAVSVIPPMIAQGRRVWFDGAWGFHWYATRAGAKPLSSTEPRAVPGDVILSNWTMPGGALRSYPKRRLVRFFQMHNDGAVRIMSRQAGAGFFSNAWGFLPWVWDTGPMDRYDLWQVMRDGAAPTSSASPRPGTAASPTGP